MKLSPRRLPALLATLSLGFALGACAPGNGTADDGSVELSVLAAASTRVLNEQLAELSDNELGFVNAGSSTLVQQLADGSPGDLLITADQRAMTAAVEQNVVIEPVELATNSMVMVVPAGNPAGITGVDASLDRANVVFCDPQVPCGDVARQIMAREGYQIDAVSLEHSAADTLGKVTSGEADAGWVYRTDAQAAGDQVEILDIPGAEDVPNTLYAAVTANTDNPEPARRLLAVLTSAEMSAIWEEHGFHPLT